MVLLMWIVIIVATIGVFILLYNILEYFMWDNFFTITLISIISIIVSLVVGGLFWGIKETYKVVDVKNYPYMQQIIIKDDSNNESNEEHSESNVVNPPSEDNNTPSQNNNPNLDNYFTDFNKYLE